MEHPTVQYINSSMVLVSWKPPLKRGGPINYYEVTVIKVDEDSGGNETFLYNTTGMRHSKHLDSAISVLCFSCLDSKMTVAQACSLTPLRFYSCLGFSVYMIKFREVSIFMVNSFCLIHATF